jgi:hypothetical protein
VDFRFWSNDTRKLLIVTFNHLKIRKIGKFALSFFYPHDQDTIAQWLYPILGVEQGEGSLSIDSNRFWRFAR